MSVGAEHTAPGEAGSLLEMRSIVKTFPGVRALDGVDLVVRPGEVHCLLGQNGAGKSTLIKVLAGAHRPDEGEYRWQGEPVTLANPDASITLGISTIYQELDLVPGLTVAENIFLGHEKSRAGLVRRSDTRKAARALLARLGHRGDPRRSRGRHAARLGPADRQHGEGPLPRHEADRDGRPVGGAGPAGGEDPLQGDSRPDCPGRGGDTSPTGSRRSARSVTE